MMIIFKHSLSGSDWFLLNFITTIAIVNINARRYLCILFNADNVLFHDIIAFAEEHLLGCECCVNIMHAETLTTFLAEWPPFVITEYTNTRSPSGAINGNNSLARFKIPHFCIFLIWCRVIIVNGHTLNIRPK